jgi:sporulation protein YlmC with PRC-barrel domain
MSTAEEVGRVDGFAVNAVAHRIHAIRVGKHKGGSVLLWSDVHAIGPDAVTVRSDDAVREPSAPLDEGGDLVSRRMLTDRGFEIGTVEDVEFDPNTGQLQLIHLRDRAIDASALLGSGRYAVVVRHPEDGNTG